MEIVKLFCFFVVIKFVQCKSLGKIKRSHLPNETVFLNDTMANIFASSVELAMDNCQKAFAWEKWNCPSNFFLLKRNSNEIDREQAFVNALLRASFIYTLAKNCSQENRDLAQPHCNVLNEIQDAENANSSSKDPLAYANFHNARAGGIAIKNSLKKLCRCHGVSGSCAIQTCWTSINAFHEITSDIKRMYDNSVLLRLNNAGNVITKNISEEQLVYLEDSPNYCRRAAIPGWKGTLGRQCSRARKEDHESSERNSCKKLCKSCGYQVKKRRKVVKQKCNYKFKWCCELTYEFCEEVVEEFYCD